MSPDSRPASFSFLSSPWLWLKKIPAKWNRSKKNFRCFRRKTSRKSGCPKQQKILCRMQKMRRLKFRTQSLRNLRNRRNRNGRCTFVPAPALVRSKNKSSYIDPLPIPERGYFPQIIRTGSERTEHFTKVRYFMYNTKYML